MHTEARSKEEEKAPLPPPSSSTFIQKKSTEGEKKELSRPKNARLSLPRWRGGGTTRRRRGHY